MSVTYRPAESDPVAEADLATHAATKRGVHGIPSSVGSGSTIVGDGSGGWTAVDIATQAELDTAASGKAQAFVPTAVKTSGYTAAPGDFVPVDCSSGSVTVTLPTAPADKSRIGVKLVAVSGANVATISRGGSSDVFNKAGGSTSLSLSLLNQAVILQYASSSGIWYVQSADLPQVAADARYAALDASTLLTPTQRPDQYGLLANRPTTTAAGDRGMYFATDDNGGTLYQVQSSAWVRVSGRGLELGYVEKTDADFTTTSTAASGADITGMSVTVTVGSRPIVVLAGGPYFAASTNASQVPAVYMFQGTTKIQTTQGFANAVFEEFPLAMRCRLSLTAGSYTFKLAAGNSSGTGTVSVHAGSAAVLWLQVLEV